MTKYEHEQYEAIIHSAAVAAGAAGALPIPGADAVAITAIERK